MSFGDDVHGRQKTGGWSQARWQRSQHEDVKRASGVTSPARWQQLLKVAPYERLLIGCTETSCGRAMVEKLHPDVRALLHDERLSLDVSADGHRADVVRRAAGAVLEEEHRAHEEAALADLREHLARQRRGAGQRRASTRCWRRWSNSAWQTLLYDEAGLSGARGPVPALAAGWGPAARAARSTGPRWTAAPDIVEEAVRAAVGQSAEMLALRDRPDLGPLGGIAATLRF